MNFSFFAFFPDFALLTSLPSSCTLAGITIFYGTFFLAIFALSLYIFLTICFLTWALYFLFTSFGNVFNFYLCKSLELFLDTLSFYFDFYIFLSFDFYLSLEVKLSFILNICKLFFLLIWRGDFDFDFDLDFDLLYENSLLGLFGSFPDRMNDLGDYCFFFNFSLDFECDSLLFSRLLS